MSTKRFSKSIALISCATIMYFISFMGNGSKDYTSVVFIENYVVQEI